MDIIGLMIVSVIFVEQLAINVVVLRIVPNVMVPIF